MHVDVCPGKAELHNFVMWVSQHVVGHASAERVRERHPSGPVMALTGFPSMQRYPDYSECLCKPSALSPFLLITRSPMQTSSAQVLTQTLAQTRDSHGQSSLCISPTSITSLPSSCNPLQASTPFPGIPWVLLGTGQKLLAQAALDTLETVCSSLGACRLTLSRAGLTFPMWI